MARKKTTRGRVPQTQPLAPAPEGQPLPQTPAGGLATTIEALAAAALRRAPTPAGRRQDLETARATELLALRVLTDADEQYLTKHALTVELELGCAALNDIPTALVAGIEHERRMRLEAPIVTRAQRALGQLSGEGASQVVLKFFADVLGQIDRGENLPDGLRRVVEVLGLAKGPVLTNAGKHALTIVR